MANQHFSRPFCLMIVSTPRSESVNLWALPPSIKTSAYKPYLFRIDTTDPHNTSPQGLIKSPRSGVTLRFQFVSAASAVAKSFPSHVKTVSAKPLIYGTKNIWVRVNVLDYLSMTLAQGRGYGVDKQQIASLRDNVRTTHRITTQRGSFVVLAMVITR